MLLHACNHLLSRCSRENSGIRTTSLSNQKVGSCSSRVDFGPWEEIGLRSHFPLEEIFQNAQLKSCTRELTGKLCIFAGLRLRIFASILFTVVLFVVSLGRCTVSYTVDLFFISLGAEAQVKGGVVYARILGGSLCNISYFKSDTISNLQKTGVHFTNFCENPTYHKKSQPRMCKISQSQFCSWGEGIPVQE